MVTGNQPVELPYPWIEGLTKRQQEQIYLDFQAMRALGQGTRWRTIVIAASNSSAAGRKAADYRCSGADDQNVINTAINALQNRSGTTSIGRIVLLEGLYNLSDRILINALGSRMIAIEGMGGGAGVGADTTVAGTIINSTHTSNNAIFLGGNSLAAGSTVILENIKFNLGSSAAAVGSRDMGLVVRQCTITQSGGGGGITQTNSTGHSGHTRIENNFIVCTGGGFGVEVAGAPSNQFQARVTGNHIKMTGSGAIGIKTDNNASNVPSYEVSDNYIVGSTTSGAGYGILCAGNSTAQNMVANNVVINHNTGISIAGFQSIVTGNLIQTCAYGIDTSPFINDNLMITGNSLLDCATAGVRIQIGNRNTVIGNKLGKPNTTAVNAVVLGPGTPTNTMILYNDWNGATSGATIVDGGTGTFVSSDIPSGGAANYVLKKLTATSGDIGWALDPAIDQIGAAGDLLVGLAADQLINLGIDRDGQILMTDSTQVGKVKWGPKLTISNVQPTLPRPGDIWIDTT